MAEPRTIVIVNPQSQGGATGRRWPELASVIRRHFPFEVAMTQRAGDATVLARQALRAGAERVIAVGGDGTVNEVVNGFFADGVPIAPTAAFGLLPFGTGGDFRRTFEIPRELDRAAAVIATDVRRPIDLGRLDYTPHDGDSPGTARRTRLFANIASFGISGLVDRLVNESSKRLGGRVTFALATARATWRYQNQRVHLRFDDGRETADLTINTVAVANGRYFGGGMHIAPEAEPDDGFFDVVALGDLGFADLLLRGRRIYAGTHLTMDKVSHRRARAVDAEPTDPGALIEIDLDGENLGQLPARFSILPRALNLIVPGAASRP